MARSSGRKVWLEESREQLDLAGRLRGGRRACSRRERRGEDVPMMRGTASDIPAQDCLLHTFPGCH